MNLDEPLTETEIENLETALISEDAPENCMDVSMLDGFLTCLAIGPEAVESGRWLPQVWGDAQEEAQGGFSNAEEAEKLVPLIIRLMNSIVRRFTEDPEGFSPILYYGESPAGGIMVIDEWCMGFMRGIEFCGEAWAPFFDEEEHRHLITPMFHFGTEEGWKQLEEDHESSAIPHEEWVEMLKPGVDGIRAFWAGRRDSAGV